EGLLKVEFYRLIEGATARKYRVPGTWLNEHAYLYGLVHVHTFPIDEEKLMAEISERLPPIKARGKDAKRKVDLARTNQVLEGMIARSHGVESNPYTVTTIAELKDQHTLIH